MGHTGEINTVLLPLKRASDARVSLIRMRLWSSRNFMTSQTCKRRKRALTFLVFPSVKFCEKMPTSQYNLLTKFYLRISLF